MTELHLALIALGAVLVAAVLGYNHWQERRARQRAEEAFGSDHPDVLLAPARSPEERREPVLGELPVVQAPAAAPDAEREALFEPILAPGEKPPRPSAAATDAGARPSTGVSDAIDTRVVLLSDAELDRGQLAPLLDALESHTTHVGVEGLSQGAWRPIEGAEGGSWREFRFALQLASRSGPVAEDEIVAFQEAVAGFAAGCNAVAQREPAAEAAARARALDRFCADADIEVVVNVVGKFGATLAMPRVKALALEHGLSETSAGLVRYEGSGAELFALRRLERSGARPEASTVPGITLALDLPHVADPVAALEAMVELAEVIAGGLGGELVDDNRKPLTAAGIAAIRRQVVEAVAAMDAAGVPPGSALARRLFA